MKTSALRSGLISATVALGTAAVLSGCGATAVSNGRPTVVAGLYPLAWLTQEVAGKDIAVENLTQPGQEPHDLELSPKQTADVSQASLVVYEKGLQAAVDAAAGQNSGGTLLDVTAAAGLEPLSHHGHDDVNHTPGVTQDAETNDAAARLGDKDPHFWQDPLKVAAVGRAVAAALGKIDPAHASEYAANAAALQRKMSSLDTAYATGLAHCARNVIVVSHNAFGYLWRYGLTIEPIAGLSPDAEPTPADLGRLQQLITAHGITTVFGERLIPAALSQTLAHDTGATAAVLDPIEGLDSATSSEDYVSLMRANLAAIRKANACQ